LQCLCGYAKRRYAECRFGERRGACAAAALRTSTHFFLLSTFDMTGKFVFQRKKNVHAFHLVFPITQPGRIIRAGPTKPFAAVTNAAA
jgi:hypothetical protein